MQEILKRIDRLIDICKNYVDEADHSQIVFEIQDLIYELYGINSIYATQFETVAKSNNTNNQKSNFYVGILNAIKNSLKRDTKFLLVQLIKI